MAKQGVRMLYKHPSTALNQTHCSCFSNSLRIRFLDSLLSIVYYISLSSFRIIRWDEKKKPGVFAFLHELATRLSRLKLMPSRPPLRINFLVDTSLHKHVSFLLGPSCLRLLQVERRLVRIAVAIELFRILVSGVL